MTVHADGNLVYLNNRHHDPTTGTFIPVDPLVQLTGQPYSYANNNPTTLSDPDGLCPMIFHDGETCYEAMQRRRKPSRRGNDGPSTDSSSTYPNQPPPVTPRPAPTPPNPLNGDTPPNAYDVLEVYGCSGSNCASSIDTMTAGPKLAVFGLAVLVAIRGGGAGARTLSGFCLRFASQCTTAAGATTAGANAFNETFGGSGAGGSSGISRTISRQTQLRHVYGTANYRGGGFFDSLDDAQRVLDAMHDGSATHSVRLLRMVRAVPSDDKDGVPEGDPFGGPVAMRLWVGGSGPSVGRTRLG